MSVAVITPWQDHLELWAGYKRAIDLGPEPDELHVIDNGSKPPLGFATIRNRKNRGFTRACNQGLHAAMTDIVVFLNNDIVATEAGWLEELCDEVEPGAIYAMMGGVNSIVGRYGGMCLECGQIDENHVPFSTLW